MKILYACIIFVFCLKVNGQIKIGLWENYDKYTINNKYVYKNSKEYKNSKDDDGNGYIDDINGIAFNTNEELYPEYFYANFENREKYDHGTAVADIITQNNQNVILYAVGFVPTSKRLKDSLLNLKTEDRISQLNTEFKKMKYFVSESIKYFAQNEVKIVNLSWGLSLNNFIKINKNIGKDSLERRLNSIKWLNEFKKIITEEIKSYPEIVFVISAGNNSNDIEKDYDILALIDLPNVIIVGSCNADKKISDFSNFGKNITVFALGENVTYKKSLKVHETNSGTSLSAPLITAFVANEIESNKTINEIKQQLMKIKYFIPVK